MTAAVGRGMRLGEDSGGSSAAARLIAFYLPQFHPTPENDEWWGRGFTEWTNVVRARPLFEGHYQPHLPANLGFYDLRVPEVRAAQASMAARYGIEGFCYWHYWFRGRRLLRRPLDEVLATGSPDFPFCLAWANETWSRRWLGEDREVLLAQEYSPEDDLRHARWLAQVFADPRYLRVNGRPLFLVYRPTDLPSPQRTADILRSEALRAGVGEPYLVGTTALRDMDYRSLGFDSTLAFEPQLGVLSDILGSRVTAYGEGLRICDYVAARGRMTSVSRPYDVHRSIFVSWDNTPRRGANGIVFVNSAPEHFEAGLAELVRGVRTKPPQSRLVFINAWNEWAEGNHLEPDQRHGLRYLEAVRRVNRDHRPEGREVARVR